MSGLAPVSRRLLSLAGAVLAIAAFQAAGNAYYRGFRTVQGGGMTHLLPDELAFLALFTFFGIAAWAAFACALTGTSVAESVASLARAASRRPGWCALAAGALTALACAWIGHQVLGGAVVTDDEHVYRFIARTLRTGAVVAPSPGADLAFYVEQFVVITDTSRYGKYPLGHPLVLALAQQVGLERLAMPLVTGLIAWPLAAIGLRLLGPARTVLALALFATSPQVLFTGATYLSQPTSALCLAGGCALLLAGESGGRRGALLCLGAGASFGFGVFVRPLPGVLFAAAAVGYLFFRYRAAALRDGRLPALVLPIALASSGLLLVNHLQAGSALTSAYQTVHGLSGGGVGIVQLLAGLDLANGSMSIASHLIRVDAWLFGWPLSLLFVPLARRRGPQALCWAMLAAALAYRLVSPKAGVGTTGPQYFFEIVPLLCLLTADGLARLPERVRGLAPALVLGGMFVSLTMFLPSRLADLSLAGRAQNAVWDRIRRQGVTRALVFHDGVVPAHTGLSWAYFPRCNGPRLDDDVLFVRMMRAGGDLRVNEAFWRQRHPDRTAWYFEWEPGGGGPRLVELGSYLSRPPGPSR
jgi:hypothetical protein